MHIYRLDQIERLFGFSGTRGIGTQLADPVFRRPDRAMFGECGSSTAHITLIPNTVQPDVDSLPSESHDIEALDHEEHKVITEDMADFLYSIND